MTQGEFERRLGEAGTCWSAVVLLLELVRARPAEDSPRARACERWDLWAELVEHVEDHFDRQLDAGGVLSDVDRARISAWTSRGTDLDAVDAVANGIDKVASASFASAWRDQLCAGGHLRHTLAVGDFYPIGDPQWPLAAGSRHSSRPGSVTRAEFDELPHVRVHRPTRFEIVVDFRFERVLEPSLTSLARVATLHPNDSLEAFDFHQDGQRVFPVRIVDADTQGRTIVELLDRALDGGASLVVIPELATTPEIVGAIARRLDRVEREVVVVAGSHHMTDAGRRVNRTEAIVSGVRARMCHDKLIPFTNELRRAAPTKEGIDELRRPSLTIHPARDLRFCLLVCKDYLDGRVGAALDRVAANVICVPAMSRKTDAFVSRAHARVTNSQAVSVIANGPMRWDDDVLANAIVARPVARDPVASSHPDVQTTAPCVGLFDTGLVRGDHVASGARR